MALALIFRGALKPQALRSALSLPSVVLRNSVAVRSTANLSQFTTQTNKACSLLNRQGKLLPLLRNVQMRNAHIDHGVLWAVEKAWATSLLLIIPLTIISPNAVMDNIFAIAVVVHNHWGFEATVIDYVRPVFFGNNGPKIGIAILYVFSGLLLGGLFYFNSNDIGIGRVINKFWTIRNK